jgi:hypothetical protein
MDCAIPAPASVVMHSREIREARATARFAMPVRLTSVRLTGIDVAKLQHKRDFVVELQKCVAICSRSAIMAFALHKRGFANLLPLLGDKADPF